MWQTVGHEWAVALLERALANRHTAQAYLFTGASNIGKTHLARELAAALNCTGAEPPCGECWSCAHIAQGTHPDVVIVEPDGARIKIDQVRSLQHDLSLSPYRGRWRACIITDFQLATTEAANALLKTLEEPPAHAMLILTATDASLLLPTIVSRCQVLALRAVPVDQIARALVSRWQVREDRAQLLARLSAGRVGWAIRAAQDPAILADREKHLETLLELLRQGRAARITAAERLSKLDDLSDIIRLWQAWWRDVLLVQNGCEDLVANVDSLDALRLWAARGGAGSAPAALREAETALSRLEQNVNPRLAVEVMLLGWGVAAAA
jgi:DNA polymerase III subunit delta'